MRVSKQLTEVAKMRVQSGLSQKEAAAKIGVGVRYLRAIELGDMKSNRVAEKIAGLKK